METWVRSPSRGMPSARLREGPPRLSQVGGDLPGDLGFEVSSSTLNATSGSLAVTSVAPALTWGSIRAEVR